ncbi:MAG: tautomerase family protein [Euryarchaeota archaeon]|nr:tautomerase family protein [Euryarchaeota archaeon]
MPTIRLTTVTGTTDEQIQAFMEGATELAVRALGAKREGVIVHVEVLPAERYMRGGKTIAERRKET